METTNFEEDLDMGLDNPLHIAFLLILLLLVFGAKRLPEMGKSLGSGMRGFKDAIGGESTPTGIHAAPPAEAHVAPVAPVAQAVPVAHTAPAEHIAREQAVA
jgi:sec-independent protein translocase protein TatA